MQHLKEITGFDKATEWILKEQGLTTSAHVEGLPPMGASPDGLLEVEYRSGSQSWKHSVIVEYKSLFPYVLAGQGESTPGAEDMYKYAPFKKFPVLLPATCYAQMQLGMLMTCTSKCIFMQYSVETTGVRVVPFSPEWAAAMETWVRRFWSMYYARQVVPPSNFGHLINDTEYSSFLALTRRLCESAPVVKVLQSAKGLDGRLFV